MMTITSFFLVDYFTAEMDMTFNRDVLFNF